MSTCVVEFEFEFEFLFKPLAYGATIKVPCKHMMYTKYNNIKNSQTPPASFSLFSIAG